MIWLTIISVQPCHAKHGPRNFVGQDEGDPSFKAFRTALLQSIEKKDKAEIEQCLSENIGTTIGSPSGIEAFEKQWQGLDENSGFWAMAKKILEHGAQFDGETNELHAPAVSFEDDHSNFPQGIVWTKNALIFTKPDTAAPSQKAPYNDQLTILAPKQHKPISVNWLKVRTRQGAVGYMKAADVSSSFDDFAVFKKENGQWRMTWFGFAEL